MVRKQTTELGAAAISLDADWTPVLYVPTSEEAEQYRALLEGQGISTLLGEMRRGRAGGVPVLVPAELHARASELVANQDAACADWDDEDGDDDDDDFLDDDDDEDDEDEDEDDEEDEFLPDDDDDVDDEEFDDAED